jgi:FkbM family methyltransferase
VVRILVQFIRKVARYVLFHTKTFEADKYSPALKAWFQANGDKTFRLNYKLDDCSIVFDLGGYEGQWACDIYCKYRCKVFIFEPCKIFFERINEKFQYNSDIKVFQFGLSGKNEQVKLYLQREGSSIHFNKKNSKSEFIDLYKASDFFKSQEIKLINLMKINIEGGEYDLLDHLIETEWVLRIVNIQIQFHNFIRDSDEKMIQIQAKLSKTHRLTYKFEYVWENWELQVN